MRNKRLQTKSYANLVPYFCHNFIFTAFCLNVSKICDRIVYLHVYSRNRWLRYLNWTTLTYTLLSLKKISIVVSVHDNIIAVLDIKISIKGLLICEHLRQDKNITFNIKHLIKSSTISTSNLCNEQIALV